MFIIGLDFDGTCVDHQYPDIGAPVPGAIEWLKKWVAAGAKLMLWTMRHDSDRAGPVLTHAVQFLRDNGIELWAVNENPTQNWSDSHKQYAHLYVDDAGINCPLIANGKNGGRPMVDWSVVGPMVLEMIEKHMAAKSPS